jgi:two-component system CheB/CheR fusion protein
MGKKKKQPRKSANRSAEEREKKKVQDKPLGNTEPITETSVTAEAVEDRPAFPIVGIGASAGGLDAVSRLFDPMADRLGMAFVLIQHLDPTKPSLTAELLAKHTRMEVNEVPDETRAACDRVYVIPPNKYLSISGGVLHLSELVEPRGVRLPIDFFLRSLADDQQEKAIAIILSGTGSDGTLGIKAIKAHGGLSIVQDPETAQHAGMPRSAIATDARRDLRFGWWLNSSHYRELRFEISTGGDRP